jgi:hypothetical protein
MTTENSSQETASSGATSSDQTSSSAESSSTQTTQAASAPAAASEQGSVANPIASEPSAAPLAYQPNFKFKAFGKEHEIEETFRALIKDKETEEKVRKFHEKAYAMEKFQADEKKIRGEFDQFKQTTEPNMRAMSHFNNLLKNKDWDNFFGGLKVPEEEIFNWVEKRLQMRQLPPEQRADLERQAQVRQQNYAYENELSQTQQSYQKLATETRLMQLENVMARQDVSSQAQAIDKVYGQIGSFRNLVIEEAANHYTRTGEDLPADQAVQKALDKYGRFLAAQNQSAPISQTAIPGAQSQAAAQGQAPIIPHVGGSARSPIKKSPRSLDDIKKMAREAQAREGQ